MKGGCVNKNRKIGGKTFILKSPKAGESRLKSNIRKRKLEQDYTYVRTLKTKGTPVLYRVYVRGKKRKPKSKKSR